MPHATASVSNPDQLAKLKAKVEVYESELSQASDLIRNLPPNRSQVEAMLRYIEINDKLLNAYREYTKEMEKLIPR